MKTFRFIAAFSLMAMVFFSCEKADKECLTVCQNGGVVNENCGCNCPQGFTGINCENKIKKSELVNVPINSGEYHLLKPIKTKGDNEFGGAVMIWGDVSLILSSDSKKVYAVHNVHFYEPQGDHTSAWIDPNSTASKILLYTAPTGKKIEFINSSTGMNFSYPTQYNYHGTTYLNFYLTYPNHFVHRIEFIGDTSGNDLPCDGTPDNCRFKIYYDDFQVMITDL